MRGRHFKNDVEPHDQVKYFDDLLHRKTEGELICDTQPLGPLFENCTEILRRTELENIHFKLKTSKPEDLTG